MYGVKQAEMFCVASWRLCLRVAELSNSYRVFQECLWLNKYELWDKFVVLR